MTQAKAIETAQQLTNLFEKISDASMVLKEAQKARSELSTLKMKLTAIRASKKKEEDGLKVYSAKSAATMADLEADHKTRAQNRTKTLAAARKRHKEALAALDVELSAKKEHFESQTKSSIAARDIAATEAKAAAGELAKLQEGLDRFKKRLAAA